eukprot:6820359-Prymnesium_polylepis.1
MCDTCRETARQGDGGQRRRQGGDGATTAGANGEGQCMFFASLFIVSQRHIESNATLCNPPSPDLAFRI